MTRTLRHMRCLGPALVLGCAVGANDGGGGGWGSAQTTFPPTSQGTTDGSSTASGGGTDGGTDTGGGSLGDGSDVGTGGSTEPATSSTTDMSTSSTTDMSTSSTTDMSTSTSATTGGAQSEGLQNSDGSCRDFLWCAETMNVNNGVGAHSYAECYTNIGLAPPFDLVDVKYSVTDVETVAPNAPTSLSLEVRQWTGTAPGSVIASRPLTSADWQLGQHTIDLATNPVTINVSSFCIALVSNGAFQIPRDPTNNVPNRSFIIAPGCMINSYTPLTTVGNFPGNYCLGGTIEK